MNTDTHRKTHVIYCTERHNRTLLKLRRVDSGCVSTYIIKYTVVYTLYPRRIEYICGTIFDGQKKSITLESFFFICTIAANLKVIQPGFPAIFN